MPVIQTDGPSDGLASAEMHRAWNEVMGWTKVYWAENKKYNWIMAWVPCLSE